MRKIIAGFLVLVMLLSLSAAALAETLVTGINGANLRSAPSTSASIIKKIHWNEYLTVISRSGQWYYVSYNGLKGYVHSGNVTVVNRGSVSENIGQPDDAVIQQWYMRNGGTAVEQWAKAGIYGAKLRTEMNINDYNNEVHSVHYDEQVYVYCSFYSYTGDLWYYAKTTDGYVGYVHAGNIILSYGNYGW